MDLFTSMTVFIRVVDNGSFTNAAQQSNISTVMVSKHIHSLENRLGAQLLIRTTRQQKLTEFGVLYYEKCKKILKDVQDLDHAASESISRPQGTLRISIPQSFCADFFLSQLKNFHKAYPDILLDIHISDRVCNLFEDDIDIAIRLGHLPDSELVAKVLQPHQLIACAAPKYFETHPMPVVPADLADHDCLIYAFSWSSEWRMFEREWKFRGDMGPQTVPVNSWLRANSSPALRIAALNGLGIAMLPNSLIRDDLLANRLVRILEDFELPSRPIHLVYLKRSLAMPARLRSFIDFCISTLG